MKQILLLLTLIFSGCVSDQKKLVEELAQEKKFQVKIYQTKNFDIFTLQKISDNKKDLRIYIEGDGLAYINRNLASLDPTPRSRFLINFVLQDKAENILYIARACQFVQNKKCEEKYWTDQRFSKEAVDAIQEVIDHFLQQKQILIGYSGGAAIINHLNHKNTKKIITIAGNLDLEAFTRFHNISEIKEEKIDYEKLAQIPQLHLVGSQDDVVPVGIFYAYEKKLPKRNLVEMRVIEEAEHDEGWGGVLLK